MYRKTMILMAILAVIPAALSAQAAEASSEAQARAQAATPEARLEAAMETAARAEIPVSLLESKILEGTAKGVPMDRVAAAVETRLQALLRARDALRNADLEVASEGELLVAAEALRAGVSESVLIQITREAPASRRAVATAVLTDLVRLGYESGPASARVNAALSGGPEALVNLRAEAAASLRARGLLSTEIVGGASGGVNNR